MGERAARGEPAAHAEASSASGRRDESLEERLQRLEEGSATERPVQRKVEVPPGKILPDFHDILDRSGNVYSYKRPIRKKGKLRVEIFTSLFNSPRLFRLKGSSGDDNHLIQAYLMFHIRAREGIIDFAKEKRYKFEGSRGL